MLIIKNVHIIDPLNQRNEINDIALDEDGHISHIGQIEPQEKDQVYDGTNQICYPGFVDIHVHFRDPGQTYKEDIYTGSLAAAKGGYTHVVCMANTVPVIDSVESYLANQHKMDKLAINVYQAAAISKAFKGEAITDMEALKKVGVKMLTDDGIPLKDPSFVKKAMIEASRLNIPLSFHEEDPYFIGKAGVNDGIISQQLGFKGASQQAEIEMIKRDIELARETKATINIQHISSLESLKLVKKAKMEGLNIHAEACPHHFTLTEQAVLTHGSLAKMNPPLRKEEDRLAICEALKDGTIDIIATDHAPHSQEEKNRPLLQAPSGILGLETAYALANEILVRNNYLDDTSLIERMALNPGKLVGIRTALDIGALANLVIVDPNQPWIVENFKSKSQNSPFLHRKMQGQVMLTIAKGKIVYKIENDI